MQTRNLVSSKAFTNLRDQYEKDSMQASTALRALAVAIIAVSWLFLSGGESPLSAVIETAKSERWLSLALILSIIGLILDALQYVVSTFLFGRLLRLFDLFSDVGRMAKENSKDNKLWRRANKYGIIGRVLDEMNLNNETLIESSRKSIVEVRGILIKYGEGSLPEPSCAKLYGLFDINLIPVRHLIINRLIFWAKMITISAGGLSIIIYIFAQF